MTHFPGEHPEPPGDLARREPLLAQLKVGTTLYRLHARGKGPLYFGKTSRNRFDSPERAYGVLSTGLDEHCSFIETYGQSTGIRMVTEMALETRHLAHLTLLRPLTLIDLSNSGARTHWRRFSHIQRLPCSRSTMVSCPFCAPESASRHPLSCTP